MEKFEPQFFVKISKITPLPFYEGGLPTMVDMHYRYVMYLFELVFVVIRIWCSVKWSNNTTKGFQIKKTT